MIVEDSVRLSLAWNLVESVDCMVNSNLLIYSKLSNQLITGEPHPHSIKHTNKVNLNSI